MKAKLPFSYVLIALSITFFGLQNITEWLFGYDLLLLYGAKINQFILQGEIWRFLTPVFLHGSIVHLSFNMYALYSIGPSLERKYGRISFILLPLDLLFAPRLEELLHPLFLMMLTQISR